MKHSVHTLWHSQGNPVVGVSAVRGNQVAADTLKLQRADLL